MKQTDNIRNMRKNRKYTEVTNEKLIDWIWSGDASAVQEYQARVKAGKATSLFVE